MDQKVQWHKELCERLNKIYEQKNHDYGDSFHETFKEEGLAMARIRLSDKLNRFKTLSKNTSDQKVNDESMIDTLMDLANYAIMTVMELGIKDIKVFTGEEAQKLLEALAAKDSDGDKDISTMFAIPADLLNRMETPTDFLNSIETRKDLNT